MNTNKILVAFFSHSGNTRQLAEQIAEQVRGELFEITTVDGYPPDYSSATRVAKKELQTGFRPVLAAGVENIEEFDTIFIGYPNWWGTMPMAVFSFLESHDLSWKTLLPFCSHGGGGMGRSVLNIRNLVRGATVRDGLAVRDGDERRASRVIADWLLKSGYTSLSKGNK